MGKVHPGRLLEVRFWTFGSCLALEGFTETLIVEVPLVYPGEESKKARTVRNDRKPSLIRLPTPLATRDAPNLLPGI